MKKIETRDEWLNAAVTEIKPIFTDAGYEYPKKHIRAFCSFPTVRPAKVIGQAFNDTLSDGKKEFNCIVSPVVKEALEALGVLVHEVAHIVVGVEHQHKRPFISCARAVGLIGKPTSTIAGAELEEKLEQIIEKIGPYPHTQLSPALGAKSKKKGKDGKELDADGNPINPLRVKLASPQDEKCFFWMCMKKFEKYGAPLCPITKKPMIVVKKA